MLPCVSRAANSKPLKPAIMKAPLLSLAILLEFSWRMQHCVQLLVARSSPLAAECCV